MTMKLKGRSKQAKEKAKEPKAKPPKRRPWPKTKKQPIAYEMWCCKNATANSRHWKTFSRSFLPHKPMPQLTFLHWACPKTFYPPPPGSNTLLQPAKNGHSMVVW